MRRPGVSNITTAVVLVVLGVALVVLVYQVVSGGIFKTFERSQAGTPGTKVQIISFSPGNDSAAPLIPATVYVKNMGPNELNLNGVVEWQVFLDEVPVTIDPSEGGLPSGGYTGTLGLGQMMNITLTTAVESNVSHLVQVFGPHAVKDRAGWSPGGGT